MLIKFNNFDRQYQAYKKELDRAYEKVMTSGYYILGENVQKFEREFASYCHAEHCVSCGNGMDAIFLALKALGIGTGDKVIVPSNTYIATWIAVSRTGAIPVPVEPNPDTHNIDPKLIQDRIGKRTKAVVPVDLYGQPCDIDSIAEIKGKYPSLKIVIDAAQSNGAKYKGKIVGSLADVTAFSFYPTKNLGAIGDGGCITTNEEEIAKNISMFRNYGTFEKYNSRYIGINSRLDELQAAFLRVKLKHLDEMNKLRSKIAGYYLKNINNKALKLPSVPDFAEPSWHLFVIRSKYRDKIKELLISNHIDSIIHYPIPPHLQMAYDHLNLPAGSLPVAEVLANEVLSLPTDPFLNSEEINYLVDVVNKFKP